MSSALPLIITNLGVTNVGMVGVVRFVDEGKKLSKQSSRYDVNQTHRFMRISSTLSFLHHCATITVILGLMEHNRCYFEHWGCPKFILNNYGGYFYVHRYGIAGGIIGLGLLGLVSKLLLGSRSLELEDED